MEGYPTENLCSLEIPSEPVLITQLLDSASKFVCSENILGDENAVPFLNISQRWKESWGVSTPRKKVLGSQIFSIPEDYQCYKLAEHLQDQHIYLSDNQVIFI